MGGGGGCCVGNFCCVGNCCVAKIIKDIGKKLFGGGSRGSSSAGDTDSYDSRAADLEATVKVQNALTEFRDDTRNRSETFENDIIRESRESLDEFISEIKKYNKIKYGGSRLNLDVGNIEREQRKTEDKIHGFIVKRIAKRVSIDDDECLTILKLDPGSEKTKQMDAFYRKNLKEAIRELTDLLRGAMEKQTQIVEDRLQSRIDSIIYTVENKSSEFEKIQQIKEKDETKMEQEQIRLSHLISICDYGLQQLN